MPTTITELKTLWERVLRKVKIAINDETIYNTFFQDSSIYKIEGREMTISVTTDFACSLIEKKYMLVLDRAVSDVTESNFDIKLIAESKLKNTLADVVSQPKQTFFSNSVLNPKFTFENFVVGASNREAQQASLMIASNPGHFYNPLFIYSNSGLGKTHLLHSIGNYIKNHAPNLHILYISSDDFIDEYIRYVRGDKESDNLKDFFRGIDVLLVDDIQFLAGKDKTQEMFFFIFNSLVNSNKQIVLTSDCHPSELKGLEDRLVTRFSSGLITSIDKPDIETNIAILKKKIEVNGLNSNKFDEDVLNFLAENFGGDVRTLEGTLNRLIFYAINMKQSTKIDLNLALEALSNSLNTKDVKKRLDETRIINVVADYYNLSPAQVTGKIRTSEISLARHIAIYLCRDILDMPLQKLDKPLAVKTTQRLCPR